METIRGFSLASVLCALGLLSSLGCMLLRQQQRITQQVHALHCRQEALILLGNALEAYRVAAPWPLVVLPFKLEVLHESEGVMLLVSYGNTLVEKAMIKGRPQ